MTGSGLRERKVGEVSYRSRRVPGLAARTHTQPSGSAVPISRGWCARAGGVCGCVGVSSLRVSGWSGQKLHD